MSITYTHAFAPTLRLSVPLQASIQPTLSLSLSVVGRRCWIQQDLRRTAAHDKSRCTHTRKRKPEKKTPKRAASNTVATQGRRWKIRNLKIYQTPPSAGKKRGCGWRVAATDDHPPPPLSSPLWHTYQRRGATHSHARPLKTNSIAPNTLDT